MFQGGRDGLNSHVNKAFFFFILHCDYLISLIRQSHYFELFMTVSNKKKFNDENKQYRKGYKKNNQFLRVKFSHVS